jgi:hypothetical protein
MLIEIVVHCNNIRFDIWIFLLIILMYFSSIIVKEKICALFHHIKFGH